MKLSVIIPIFNEQGNIQKLNQELNLTLQKFNYEIIYVDDGSTDNSRELLKKIAHDNANVKLILFRRNFGQTAAMSAGFKAAKGKFLVPLDGDLQNDPNDIEKMIILAENDNYDIVSGWRKHRKDNFIRVLPSKIANILITRISGVKLHDYGCTLKVYRAEIMKRVNLYGEMHRFIPVLANWEGARITEMAVNHRKRFSGTSKYGMSRIFRVILQLITVKFLGDYSTKPLYFFGKISLWIFFFSLFWFGWTVWDKIMNNLSVINNVKFLISAFGILFIGQLLSTGVMAELMTRTYYESQRKDHFNIKEMINFDEDVKNRF